MAASKKSFAYAYPRPALTVDVALFTLREETLQVLLIQRKSPPFAGNWALPGGFVDENEPLLTAAQRELQEETGLKWPPLQEFGVFGDPGRDPRGWTVSVAYVALVPPAALQARAGDDAARVQVFPLQELPPLAFDHDKILARAWESLTRKPLHWIRQSGILGRSFTLRQLRQKVKTLCGQRMDVREWQACWRREKELMKKGPRRQGSEPLYQWC